MPRSRKDNFNTYVASDWGVKNRILFNPKLGEISGSANAGLFLSQLLFWWGKGRNPDCIYKTVAEVKKETCLTRRQQETAIRKWKELGVLKVKLFGIPPKRHFKINFEKLYELAGFAFESGCSDHLIRSEWQN